jgi:hypothetical protein
LIDIYSAAESKESGTRTPHEYIKDILPFRYQECVSCKNRTGLTCIKCGYCYSCHWKKEKAEKRLLDRTLNEIFPLSPSSRKNALVRKEAKESPLPQQQQQQLIVDVHGRTSEPICTYHRCDHKFSLHGQGSHDCKCKHPTNKTLGIFVRCP